MPGLRLEHLRLMFDLRLSTFAANGCVLPGARGFPVPGIAGSARRAPPSRVRPRLLLLLPLVGALLGFAAWGAPAHAQDPAPEFQLTLGLEGWHRPGRWSFVVLHARNPGPSVSCRAAVLVPGDRTAFTRPFDLPRGSSLRVEIPFLPSGEITRLLVRVTRSDGVMLWSEAPTQSQRTMDETTTLSVGRGASAVARAFSLQAREQPERRRMMQAVAPQALPGEPGGLEGVQALILTDLEPGSLSAAQARVLASWVAHGGNLIWLWSPGWTVDGALSGELPLPVEPRSALSLPAVEAERELARFESKGRDVAFAEVVPTEGAVVERALEKMPLLVRRRHGLGWITFLSLDLARPPLTEWPGSVALLQRAIGPAQSTAEHPMHEDWLPEDEASRLRAGLSESVTLRWISPWWLIGFTFVYALLVGPGSYALFRRFRSGPFARTAFPALVLVSSVLAAVFARGMVAGEAQMPLQTRVDVPADGGPARAETFGLILIGENRPVQVTATQPGARIAPLSAAAATGLPWAPGSSSWSDARYHALAEPAASHLHLTTRTWTAEFFAARWEWLAAIPIGARETLTAQGRALEIDNRTGAPLQSAVWVSDSQAAPLAGPFPPGISRHPIGIRIPLGSWLEQLSFEEEDRPRWKGIRALLDLTLRGPREDDLTPWRFRDRKPGNALALFARSTGPGSVLLASSEATLPPIRVTGTLVTPRAHTLFRVEVTGP